jgi:transcriptional regulator with XRE-family HTH domain
MAHKRNLIGAQVRNLRYQRGWTQEQLTAKCGTAGWDVSRGTLAKIEAAVRSVSDRELLVMANVLMVTPNDLYPAQAIKKSVSARNSR